MFEIVPVTVAVLHIAVPVRMTTTEEPERSQTLMLYVVPTFRRFTSFVPVASVVASFGRSCGRRCNI